MNRESTKNRMRPLRPLKIREGVQDLLNRGYKILGNPILVYDMDYKLVLYTENIITDDPIWNEFLTTGTASRSWIEFCKEKDFLDAVAGATKAVYLHTEKLKYDRIFARLFNRHNVQIGCVCMMGDHNPFDEDALPLFEIFCDILNEEFAKSEYYRNYGRYIERS